MSQFQIELCAPNAEADAEVLQRLLTGEASVTVMPAAATRSIDPAVMLFITAAGLQSVDIIYRFYQDWQARQRPSPGSRPAFVFIAPDGTRIELADNDPEMLKIILQK